MYSGLSLEQAPPIRVPFLFFLTAPLFGFFSVFFFSDGASRWSSDVLAATHLWVLGFVLMMMIGALFQLIPVVIGVPFRNVKLYSLIIYFFLLIGLPFFIFGFYKKEFLHLGVALILFALLLFLVLLSEALYKVKGSFESARVFKYAVVNFLLGILLGVVLVLGHLGVIPLYRPQVTNFHLLFLIMGWVGFVIIGVCYQIIPMFFVASTYPLWLRKSLAPALFIGFIAYGFEIYFKLIFFSDLWLSFWSLLFLILTGMRLLRRGRKIYDPSLFFWWIALLSAIFCIFLWIIPKYISIPLNLNIEILFGKILFFGFLFSIISAMIYKITPFLVWFHLQSQQMDYFSKNGKISGSVPHMKEIQKDRLILFHFVVHLIALLLGLLNQPLFKEGLLISFLFLEFSLVRTFTIYIIKKFNNFDSSIL